MPERRKYHDRLTRGLCTHCVKPNPDTSRPQCPDCRVKANELARLRYALNPERLRAEQTATRLARRLEALAAYGGACVCCGETYTPYLQLDHKENDGAVHRASLPPGSAGDMVRVLKREGWPPYIQILCANCHVAKTLAQPCKPHVT